MWYNWSVLLTTVSSLAGFLIIIIGHDPYTAGKLIKFLFFSSLTLVLIGLFMSLKILIKKIASKYVQKH